MRNNVIMRLAGNILIPPILIYALYTQFHGDYSPGGGFQAGVIAAAGFVLYGLIYGLDRLQKVLPLAVTRTMSGLGVLIYAGTGVAGLLMGGNYLDYDVLRHDPEHGQHLGILLVELGVLTTVCGVMLTIFYAYAGRKRLTEE